MLFSWRVRSLSLCVYTADVSLLSVRGGTDAVTWAHMLLRLRKDRGALQSIRRAVTDVCVLAPTSSIGWVTAFCLKYELGLRGEAHWAAGARARTSAFRWATVSATLMKILREKHKLQHVVAARRKESRYGEVSVDLCGRRD